LGSYKAQPSLQKIQAVHEPNSLNPGLLRQYSAGKLTYFESWWRFIYCIGANGSIFVVIAFVVLFSAARSVYRNIF
jgi:hypothetical protein